MAFLRFAEAVVFILIIAFVATQVCIPLWLSTPLFPSFRRKLGAVDDEVAMANETIRIAKTKRKAKQLREEAEDIESEI